MRPGRWDEWTDQDLVRRHIEMARVQVVADHRPWVTEPEIADMRVENLGDLIPYAYKVGGRYLVDPSAVRRIVRLAGKTRDVS